MRTQKTAGKGNSKAADKAAMRSPRDPATKRAYHHGNLREALLEAALARLETSRQPALSLRELARDVGVTVNAGYRHFADKDALLDAVAAEGFKRLAAREKAVTAAGGPVRERARALGRTYIGFARAQPALFRLMFTRSDQPADPASGSESLSADAASAFRPLLETTAEALSLPVDDARSMGAALGAWALVHGLSLLLLDRQINRLVDDPESFGEMVLRVMRFDPDAFEVGP